MTSKCLYHSGIAYPEKEQVESPTGNCSVCGRPGTYNSRSCEFCYALELKVRKLTGYIAGSSSISWRLWETAIDAVRLSMKPMGRLYGDEKFYYFYPVTIA